jgi:hypothetical protein
MYIGIFIPEGNWMHEQYDPGATTVPLPGIELPQLRTEMAPEEMFLPTRFSELQHLVQVAVRDGQVMSTKNGPRPVPNADVQITAFNLYLFNRGEEPTTMQLGRALYNELELEFQPVTIFRFDGAFGYELTTRNIQHI